MANTSNRANVLAKTHKVLKKHFEPVVPVERPVMEQILYACCLENARYELADESFARIQESFYDWNEVRVTSVRELAELMKGLPDPTAAASNLKHTLHSVFESIYDFNLDLLRKQNLGAAVKELTKLRGTTSFSVSFVAQTALGGHSIPICKGSLDVMYILGVINEKELEKKVVPGLERAIPKNKGIEFGSLLHQLAAELVASPFGTLAKGILLEIEPDAKPRLPKRVRPKRAPVPEKKKTSPKAAAEAPKRKRAKSADKPAAKTSKKVAKKVPTKKETTKKIGKKIGKKTVAKRTIKKKAKKVAKKSTTKKLSRKKPR